MSTRPTTSSPRDLRPVRVARQQFFAESGFSPDGGYEAEWDEAQVGPLRYRVPNFPGRGEVLRRHDLHHVLTDYPATWQGEALVSAWELASGAGPASYAWIIAAWGLFTGLVGLPIQTLQAWFRGRGSRSLYGEDLDAIDLDQTVDQLRLARSVRPEGDWGQRSATARLGDVLLLLAWSLLALVAGLLFVPLAAGFVAHAMARPAWERARAFALTPCADTGAPCPLMSCLVGGGAAG